MLIFINLPKAFGCLRYRENTFLECKNSFPILLKFIHSFLSANHYNCPHWQVTSYNFWKKQSRQTKLTLKMYVLISRFQVRNLEHSRSLGRKAYSSAHLRSSELLVRQLIPEIKCHVPQFGQNSSDGIKSLSDL